MQPLEVWHVYDARNGLIDPIQIFLLQAVHSGLIPDLQGAISHALEENNGTLS